MSDSEVLVRVEHVSKKFCRSLKHLLWYGVCDIAKELNPLQRSSEPGTRYSLPVTGGSGSEAAFNLPSNPSPITNNPSALRPNEFWALNDVSFQLKRGECLGLIGRNGAGKPTLLKMLNGLIAPDLGLIEMHVGACVRSLGFDAGRLLPVY